MNEIIIVQIIDPRKGKGEREEVTMNCRHGISQEISEHLR